MHRTLLQTADIVRPAECAATSLIERHKRGERNRAIAAAVRCLSVEGDPCGGMGTFTEPRRGGLKPTRSYGGPRVRIRFPPAGSQERTPHRRCTICGVGFTDVIRVSPSTANRCARPQGSGPGAPPQLRNIARSPGNASRRNSAAPSLLYCQDRELIGGDPSPKASEGMEAVTVGAGAVTARNG